MPLLAALAFAYHRPVARSILLASLVVAAASLLIAACDAEVTQSCVSGPCVLDAAAPVGEGGSDGGACEPPPKVGDYPCDVFALIQKKCHPCHHEPPAIGPFPLLTFEDTQEPYGTTGKRRYQQMAFAISPEGSPRMPYQGIEGVDVEPLTDDEYALLSGWLADCAPPIAEGQGCECPGKDCMPAP